MITDAVDQADGLRRLLAPPATRVVALLGMAGGEGVTTCAMGIGAALALQGREVLQVDEHGTSTGASATRDRRTVETRRPGGIVLVDAALDPQGRLSPLAQDADDVLVVLRPDLASITATYAGIKALHYGHGLRRMRFLVNAVAQQQAAGQIIRNLGAASSRYLAVSLAPAGWVRADAHMDDARRLGRSVVEAFPTSPASLDLRRLAGELLRWPVRPRAA